MVKLLKIYLSTPAKVKLYGVNVNYFTNNLLKTFFYSVSILI